MLCKLRDKMVYLNLSVANIEEAVEFYSKRLGVFDFQSDRRLICNLDVDLIIDLFEVGTESHLQCFGQEHHAPSSFWIHAGGDEEHIEIEIIEKLKVNGVQFEDVGNLGGHFLAFTDPSNNKFKLHAHFGVFK